MQSIKQVMSQTVPSMTLVSEGDCEHCGHHYKTYETQLVGGPHKGEKTEVTYGCKCEDIKLAKQAEESHKHLGMKKVKKHFDYYSLINKRLKKASIESYKPRNKSQEIAKRSVEKFVSIFDLENPINLLFTGGYGVGKSHLAKAVTDKVMSIENGDRRYTAIFISVPKLLRKIRSTYNRDSEISEADIFRALETVDLLVLDDLGAERQNDWTDERLFDLIDSRQGMHTIYTSNYKDKDLFDILGERNFSRVMNEDTKIIEIEGSNYRLNDMDLT